MDAALSAAAGLLALLISALNFWNQELLLGLLVLLPGWMWMSVVLFFTGVRCGRGKVTKEAETGGPVGHVLELLRTGLAGAGKRAGCADAPCLPGSAASLCAPAAAP